MRLKIPLQHEGVARSDGVVFTACSHPARWAPLQIEGELSQQNQPLKAIHTIQPSFSHAAATGDVALAGNLHDAANLYLRG